MRKSQNSIEALMHQIRTGNVRTQQAQLLSVLMTGPASILRLSSVTGIEKSTITARMTDLLKKGLVYEDGSIRQNKKTYTLYRYEPEADQRTLRAQEYQLNRCQATIQRMCDDFSGILAPATLQALESELT